MMHETNRTLTNPLTHIKTSNHRLDGSPELLIKSQRPIDKQWGWVSSERKTSPEQQGLSILLGEVPSPNTASL